MKKESSNKAKLGVFVTIGVLLFMVAIYFVGQTQKLFSTTFIVTTTFKDIDGLQVGNNVRFAGITVGTVDNVQIESDTIIRIHLLIDEDVQKFIKKDSRAEIGSDGLMGNKIVTILPGSPTSSEIESGDVIGSIPPMNMDEIMEKLRATADNTEIMTKDLATITNNVRNGKGTIGKIFMDEEFADNLDATLINVRKSSEGLSQNMEALKENILLRGYYKKKAKKENKKKEEMLINKEQQEEKQK